MNQMPTLVSQADSLADIMLKLATKSENERTANKASRPLLKLPPVFTAHNDEKYGCGKRNLVAMIKCAAEYEDGFSDGSYPILAELPKRYNAYGGLPNLDSSDLRKVHNWLQHVSFGLRAAVMEQEEKFPTTAPGWEGLGVVERTAKRLFDPNKTRRVFVAHPINSLYEFKPLRYADSNAILRWLKKEYSQKKNGTPFGVQPTTEEWETYGLRGQTRTEYSILMNDIHNMVHTAKALDQNGNHREADKIHEKLMTMKHNLEQLTIITLE